MHLLIDIKHHWKLAFTSTQGDAIGKAAREGIQTFSCKDSDLTISDHYLLGPLPEFDEKPSSHKPPKPQRPFRCRSFRKFWPISVHISRKRCVDPSCPFYFYQEDNNEDIRKAPRYWSTQASEFSELACSSAQELPQYRDPVEILDQNELFELPVPASEQGSIQAPSTKTPHTNAEYQQLVPTQVEVPGEMDPRMIDYTMHQFYPNISPPPNLSNRPVGPPSASPPLMSYEAQSQASSPISPCTPTGSINAQNWYLPGRGMYDGMVSPPGVISPNTSLYGAPWQPPPNPNAPFPYTGSPVPTYMGTTKASSPLMPSRHPVYHPPQTPQTPQAFGAPAFFPTHAALGMGQGYGLGPSNHSTMSHEAFRYGAADPLMGNQEPGQNPQWFHQRDQTAYVRDTGYSYAPPPPPPPQQSPVLSEPTQGDYPVTNGTQEVLLHNPDGEPSPSGPRAICPVGLCRAIFKGKYRKGNLARHIRSMHNGGQPLPDTTCRVCGKTFKRSDAKRKHEYLAHQLEDSKPGAPKRKRTRT